MTFSFAHRLISEHHLPRGPNEYFAPRPEISLGAPSSDHLISFHFVNLVVVVPGLQLTSLAGHIDCVKFSAGHI